MNWTCFEIGENGLLSAADCGGVVERWRDGGGPFWIDVENEDRADLGVCSPTATR